MTDLRDDPSADAPISPDVPAGAAMRSGLTPGELAFIEMLVGEMRTTLKDFRFELWVYRVGSVAALLLVIGVGVYTVVWQDHSAATLGTFVGTGGLFGVTGMSTTYFLRRQLKTLRDIIFRVLEMRHG